MFKKKLQIYMMWQEHQEQQEGKESRLKIIKRWIWEHNKYIAAVIAVIVFSGLLALVIYDVETKDESGKSRVVSIIINEAGQSGSKLEVNLLKTSTSCKIASDKCTIECKNTNVEELAEQINRIQLRGCSGSAFLSLEQVSFQQMKYRIDKGWLNGTTTSFGQLKFRQCDLQDLGPNAFAGIPFSSLKYLTLDQININELRKESFNNIFLSNLEIKFDNFVQIRIEEKVFEGLTGTLQILQMERCLDSDGIQNVVGNKSARFLNMKQLYLDCNTLGYLEADSFISATTVTEIRLTSSSITGLHEKTFRNLYSLKRLSLSDNLLTTIPQGIFDSITVDFYAAIYIDHNPWNCNCDLEWLKFFCINHENMCMGGFDCLVRSNEINYLNVTFCSNESTPATPHTTSMTTEETTSGGTNNMTEYTTSDATGITTEHTSFTKDSTEVSTASSTVTDPSHPDGPIISIECEIATIVKNSKRGTSKIISVRLNTVDLGFYQIGDDPMFEIIITRGDVAKKVILVFDSLDKTKKSCTMNLTNHTLVHNLNHGRTYTLCLMPSNAIATPVSPFDCTGLTVPPEWGARAWIPNKSMSVVISAICGSLLAIILVSSLIMFYCIRQHPNLIKGNKRVIIVESKAADAIVMPKNYDQLNYVPPSLNSYSDGYLTPKQEFYVHDGRRKVVLPMLPTISERSSFAVSTSRIRRSHIRRRAKLEQVAQAFDDHVYEQPPPLPPNHPCNDRKRKVNYTYI